MTLTLLMMCLLDIRNERRNTYTQILHLKERQTNAPMQSWSYWKDNFWLKAHEIRKNAKLCMNFTQS